MLLIADAWWGAGQWIGLGVPAGGVVEAVAPVSAGGLGRPVYDYPIAIANRDDSVAEIAGPTSYTAMVNGVPPGGGQLVSAAEFGLKFFEWVDGTLSDDAQYFVQASYGGSPGAVSSITLRWIVGSTGIEVAAGTNLSARRVRLRAVGRN